MYKAHWNMTCNPFSKNNNQYCYESEDYHNAHSRLKYLTTQKGFGLFTGQPGTGKTFTLRAYLNSLNKNLYKVFYTPLSTVTLQDFYRNLAYGLDIDPSHRKAEVYRQIQERIISLSKDKRITPCIVIDEAQYLNTSILNDLKIIFNFDMDSVQHAVVILAGLPVLNHILGKAIHEAIAQRIIINYAFIGLSRTEMETYIANGLSVSGANENICKPAALEALYSASGGSIRKLNALICNALIIGTQNKLDSIDTDTVMAAQNELQIV